MNSPYWTGFVCPRHPGRRALFFTTAFFAKANLGEEGFAATIWARSNRGKNCECFRIDVFEPQKVSLACWCLCSPTVSPSVPWFQVHLWHWCSHSSLVVDRNAAIKCVFFFMPGGGSTQQHTRKLNEPRWTMSQFCSMAVWIKVWNTKTTFFFLVITPVFHLKWST